MILFVVYHILEENARVFFCFLQKAEKNCSDVQKVADGKFVFVGDCRKDAAKGRQKDLIGLHEFVVCVCCFEVCGTSKLPL